MWDLFVGFAGFCLCFFFFVFLVWSCLFFLEWFGLASFGSFVLV